MINDTINDDRTVVNGGEDMMLVKLYHSPIVYRDHSRKTI